MSVSVLKPCPFCGAKGRQLRAEPWVSVHGTDGFVIDCRGCEAVGPMAPTVAKARAAWNVRKAAA